MLQTFARALAGHFDQPERRHRGYLVACVILGHRLLEHLQNIVAVPRLLHIDEIDNDDAAEIP